MTISCWRWLKTAINGGNLWSTAPQPKDYDDDEDDDGDDVSMSRDKVEDHGGFRNGRRFKRSASPESCSQLRKGVLIVFITLTIARTAMAFRC